jgi:hypothetical protein
MLEKFESWFYCRYHFNKLNINYFNHKMNRLKVSVLSTCFFNVNKMYSRDFFSIYVLFLDLNISKPPLFLKTKLFYRGKSSSRVTVLSTILQNKYNLEKLQEEILFFIIFRNLDYRRMLFFSFYYYYKLRQISLFFNVRKFSYNLRDLKHLSLPSLTLSYSCCLFWIFDWKKTNSLFVQHFIFIYFSFFFFFYDDYNKELSI